MVDQRPVPLGEVLNLSGKVAVVTGASRGIGSAIAMRLAEAGAGVVVGYLERATDAEKVVAAIQAAGGSASAAQVDVSQRDSVDALFAGVGRVDVLVNNAGIYPLKPLLDLTDEDWKSVVDANLTGVHLGTQIAGRVMTPGSSIVNIASIEALAPAPAHAHYNAAKAAVLMHTRSAALELGPRGIRVNAVSPGLIFYDALPTLWPDGVARYEAAAPLGRLGAAAEVADAVLFMASRMSRFVTGANLVVDGGVTATPSF